MVGNVRILSIFLFLLIGVCSRSLPMGTASIEQLQNEFLEKKLDFLNQYKKMVAGYSPSKEFAELPKKEMEFSNPEAFGDQVTEFNRKSLLQKLEKKGVTQDQLNEQALKENEIIQNNKDALLGSQPASLVIEKMVLDQVKKNGITRNLKVFKTDSKECLTQTDGSYIWVNEKRFKKYTHESQKLLIDHECEHIKNNDISVTNAVAACLETKNGGTLSPHSRKIYALFHRDDEARADCKPAFKSLLNAQAYAQAAQRWVEKEGHGQAQEHPKNIHRFEASDMIIDLHMIWHKLKEEEEKEKMNNQLSVLTTDETLDEESLRWEAPQQKANKKKRSYCNERLKNENSPKMISNKKKTICITSGQPFAPIKIK